MSTAEKRWRKRVRMFEAQAGLCFYCQKSMVLMFGHHKHQPDNLATIEHLRDRLHEGRREPPMNQERRQVLACFKCNNLVGAERYKALPIEEQRERAGRYPVCFGQMVCGPRFEDGPRTP